MLRDNHLAILDRLHLLIDGGPTVQSQLLAGPSSPYDPLHYGYHVANSLYKTHDLPQATKRQLSPNVELPILPECILQYLVRHLDDLQYCEDHAVASRCLMQK